MEELFKPLADRGDASTIDLDGALAAGRQAYKAFDAFGTAALKWGAPCNLNEQASKLVELCKGLQAGLRRMAIARDAIRLMTSAGKAALAKDKKQWHENKVKVITWLVKSAVGLPDSMAKLFGELLYSVAKSPSSVGVASLFEMRA